MMLKPEEYIAEMGDKVLEKAVSRTAKEACAKLARKVAESVVKHLELEVESGEYLFKTGGWMDPGPLVDLTPVHNDWDSTPVRPGRSDTKEPTVKDIITGKWLPPSDREKSDPKPRVMKSRRKRA